MKKAILIGVPHHNNLGDSAIAIAEKKFIEENLKEYEYYEISEETAEHCMNKIKGYVQEEDIIFFHGGGNLGNQYLYIEEARRKMVQLFSNNKIIFFPQTIYFTDDEEGMKELEKSKEIYSKHKDLTIVAREKKSYEIMKKEFGSNRVVQTPDIVTYINATNEQCERKGILLLLRSDLEKKLTNEQIEQIEKVAKKHNDKIEYDDTAKGAPILAKDRKKKLEELLNKIRKAEIVITDRLHGMIFSAITSTPCIALDNYNHKIKEASETLKHLKYIKYIDKMENLEKEMEYLINTEFEPYDNSFAVEQLRKSIKGV